MPTFDAVVFDLDGVITATASVHSAAWKQMFDEYLRRREAEHGEAFREFTHTGDYLPYVDGKPRYKGVASFLESRGLAGPRVGFVLGSGWGHFIESTEIVATCQAGPPSGSA